MASFTATSCILVIIIIKGYLFNPTAITNLKRKGKSLSSGSCTQGIPSDHKNELLAIKRVMRLPIFFQGSPPF